jgi:carbamoyl-phosphate synthase large subunit
LIGYPVIVRPSYVLGGRAMQIVDNDEELIEYAKRAFRAAPGHPVLIDRYIAGIEVEVDAVCDGQQVLIPGIMEHVERAGIHSGDSIAVYPPQRPTEATQARIVDYTEKLALGLHIKGLINIQFVVAGNEVYVLEVNPRSSRTVPFISKATNVPLVKIATKVALGETLAGLGVSTGLLATRSYVAVKAPVFSFAKLPQVDALLGPEMKSTGEVMGIDACYTVAMYKALTAAGWALPQNGIVLFNVAGKDFPEAAALAQSFFDSGYQIAAAGQTASYFLARNVPLASRISTIDSSSEIAGLLKSGAIGLTVSTMIGVTGDSIRRQAIQCGVPCLTSLDTTRAVANVLAQMGGKGFNTVTALQDYAIV